MKAELRGSTSPDLESDTSPSDPLDCKILIEAMIGPKDQPGEESFQFVVATPSALSSVELPRWGRGLLLVESFDWKAVGGAVEKVLSHCEGADWDEVAGKIGRYADWEFDGYVPYKGV